MSTCALFSSLATFLLILQMHLILQCISSDVMCRLASKILMVNSMLSLTYHGQNQQPWVTFRLFTSCLRNARVPLGCLPTCCTVPANPHDPLFPWRDSANNGIIYPMVRDSVLQYINFITEVKDGEARLAIL